MDTAQRFVPNDSATVTVASGAGNLAGSVRFRLYDNATCTPSNTTLYDKSFNIATQNDGTGTALRKLLDDGPIQIVVNNAGIHDDAVMPGMRPEQWSRVIDVSLNGFFNVTQPLLMPMIGTRWGRIVNVSSAAALAGNRGQTNYAAAKAGLHGATKALALELASRGITVNAVAPGIIESAMTEGVFSRDAIEKFVPMKRAGTPEEVADLIGFLASERAAYISGQIISINGAMI